MTLGLADLETLVSALPHLYEADDLGGFPASVLRVLRLLVAGDGYSYNDVNAAAGTNLGVVEPSARVSEELRRRFEQLLGEHPAVTHFIETSDGRAYAISDFISRAAYRRRAIYADLYRRLQVEDQLSIGVGTAPRFIGLCVNRDQWGFSDRDRQMLELLGAHVSTAYRAVSEHTRLRAMLGAGGLATVQSSPDGLRIDMDDLAGDYLAAGFERWSASSRHLPDELRSWVKAQQHSFETDPSAPLLPLVVERRDARFQIRFVPGTSATGWSLVIQGDVRPPGLTVAPKLRLTAREREVVQLLATGASSREIADALVVSRHTVHRHLQNLYEKLGVRTRLAAVAKVRESELVD